MYCSSCGRQNNDNSRFCRQCGQLLQQLPYQPGQPVQIQAPIHAAGMYPSQKKKKKRSGQLIGFSAVLLVLVGLFLLGQTGNKPRILAEAKAAAGMITLNQASFKLDDDQNARDCLLTARELATEDSNNNFYRSNTYELEGELLSYDGKIRVDMPIPDDLLADSDLQQKLIIELAEWNPQDDVAYFTRQIDARIDWDRQMVWAEIDLNPLSRRDICEPGKANLLFSASQSGSASPDYINNPRFDWSAFRQGTTPRNRLSFRYTYSGIYYVDRIVETDDYRVIIENTTGSDIYFHDLLPVVIDYLEEAKGLAEQAGFSFAAINKPFDVYIRDIDQSGRVEVSSLFKNDYHMVLAKRFFIKDYEVSYSKEQLYRKLKALVGHELLHVGQYLIHKDQAHWMHEELSWMKEATARWFEPTAIGSANFLDETVLTNTDFILQSLYLNDQLSDHYGAALFMVYLQGKIPDQTLMADLFTNSVLAYQQSDIWTHYPDNISIQGLERTVNGKGITLPALWAEFAARYFVDPKSIHSRLNTIDIRDSITLLSENSGESDRIYRFDPNLILNKARTISRRSGRLQSPDNPSLEYEQILPNLSATCTDLQIRAANGAFDTDGKLEISVVTSGQTGVMVYSIRGSAYAGSMAYLSSSGTTSLVIDDFSTGTTGDLSIIAFNYDTSETLQNSPVRIKIVYTPEREPEPTPTPGPVETTDPVTADPDGPGTSVDLLTGVYNGIGVGYWEEDWRGSRIRIESSELHDGQYMFASDGSCYFGYVSKSSGSRTVYSKHFGTYQVLKEDSIKKGRLSISENGTKLPDAVHVIQMIRISYTHTINTATGERAEWESGDDIVIVDGRYILTGYGFNAYKKEGG